MLVTSMIENNVRSIQLPPSEKHPNGHNLPLRNNVLVIVGANGSGKTRMGAWLDSQDVYLRHRVSAHRSLVFPDSVMPMDYEMAQTRLFTGHKNKDHYAINKLHSRWGNQSATALLDDFEPLVTLMISESFKVSDSYRVTMLAQNEYISPPQTRLDLVKSIWETVLPARELVITGNRIEARNRQDKQPYHAKEMSDGERGIFHLIGEALSVPKNGMFIVDEPELHLHRAIQARLWDAIEASRPDCTFVYVTHDLGFAASRKDATKVWLREYRDNKWDWVEIPESDVLPETLLLEVIGSRRPVLFVEGDRSSHDYFIYGKVFPGHSVVPCGSCEIVVHSTCSFTEMASLHHNTCAGIVDNDGRSRADIEMLSKLGIAVLPVALVENLFLLESVLAIAAEKLGHDPKESIARVKERVFANVTKNQVRIVSNLTRQEIESALRVFGKSGDGVEALVQSFQTACAAIDPASIYAKWNAELTRVISENDYSAALRYYKTKGLHSEAGVVFGVKYQDQIVRWLRGKDAASLVAAFKAEIPSLPMKA